MDAKSQQQLKDLYRHLLKFEKDLGGGEGVIGTNGSLTPGSLHKVLTAMVLHCGLGEGCKLVDIGSGIGRVLLHALVLFGVQTVGIEIDSIKVDKSREFINRTVEQLFVNDKWNRAHAIPTVVDEDVEKVLSVRTLGGPTHAFSFWQGVPPSAKKAFGRLFARSRRLRSVAVVQHAVKRGEEIEMMRKLHFGKLVLVHRLQVTQQGSGGGYTAYVFNKAPKS